MLKLLIFFVFYFLLLTFCKVSEIENQPFACKYQKEPLGCGVFTLTNQLLKKYTQVTSSFSTAFQSAFKNLHWSLNNFKILKARLPKVKGNDSQQSHSIARGDQRTWLVVISALGDASW